MQYKTLVEVYQQLEGTSKRLEKTNYLAEFFKKVPSEEMEEITLLVQGQVFPDWDERKLGMAAQLLIKAIQTATGRTQNEVEQQWKKTGDLGTTAEILTKKKTQATLTSRSLTARHVFESLQKLASLTGQGTVDRKVQLVAELLTSATPAEAKYIIRTILQELRVGLGEGTIRDALVWAFVCEVKYDAKTNELVLEGKEREHYGQMAEELQEACDVVNDFSKIAKLIRTKGIKGVKDVELEAGRPVKVMLFQKVADVKEAFETVGKPAAFEYKFDGFRMQIHKKDKKVVIYTRRLENVTAQFPEVVDAVQKNVSGKEYILDGEAVGIDPKTKKYMAFQQISQRIKRKYEIEETAKKFPMELDLFDVLYYNGKTLLKEPFEERRKLLDKITKPAKGVIKLADQIVTDDEKKAQRFFEESLEAGNEGVMAKNLKGIYKPGSRVGYGVKLKTTMETLEVVVVGAEWGEGKRARWLSSYVIACRDQETKELKEIGRVSTGLKEKPEEGTSFDDMTKALKPLVIEEKGKEVTVKPEVVIEVDYEEIQKSPTYASGYALRFPRFVRLRLDRGPRDISTLEEVEKLYGRQRGRR